MGFDGRNDKYFDYSSSGKILQCFLNIRNPLFSNDTSDWKSIINSAQSNGYDGIIYGNDFEDKGSQSYIIFKPNQTKSVTRNNGEYSTSNDEFYKQTANTQNERSNSLETLSNIPREQITAVRKKYKGTTQWMKAPNGEKTHLTQKQWLQVRTPDFKAWFGDWENDPDNASQVVDENGEPLVLYHRTQRGNNFSIFHENSDGIHFGTRRQADDRAKGKLFAVFLNVRNPDRTYDQGASWYHYVKWTKAAGYDGIVYLNEVEGVEPGTAPQDSWIVFEPNQIKSATKNNGYFDSNNPDIYKQTVNDEQPFYGIDADGRQLMLRFNTPEIDALYEKHKEAGTLFRAPNGKKSNLPERAWLLVRTPAFKQWFGDWENNPQGASKVIDDNGEPLIVIHMTGSEPFSSFDTSGKFGIKPYKTKDTGAWFADLKGNNINFTQKEGENIYHVFLNIRNPFVYDAEGRDWSDIGKIWIVDENSGEPIYHDKDGKPFLYDYQAREYIRTVLRSNPRYYYEHDRRYPTTDDLVRAVRRGRLGNGYHDGVIIRNVGDLGYNNIDDYVIFKPIQVKSRDNNGAFSTNNAEIYKQVVDLQNNPLVETYRQVNPFTNPMSEAIYRRGMQPEKPKSAWKNIKQYLREIRKGFRGDFPLLAGQEAKDKGLTAAREILRIMNRNSDAKSHMVMVSLYGSLHGLNAEQFDIFSRLMLINDIYAFKANNPNADLPMDFTPKTLKTDKDYLVSLATKDKKILNALLTENENNKKARQDLVNIANELGFASLAKRLQSTDLFLIQYAKLLDGEDFNTNYVIAIADMRTTMLQDLERLLAVKKLKEKGYDKKSELIQKYGDKWKLHIPKGYSIFNPLSGQFIQSAQSLTENVIGLALEEAGKQLGLSEKTMSILRAKLSDKLDTQDMVLPDEITQTLDKLTKHNERSPLYKFAKTLTNGWKKYVLYFPTRVWKYNLRNITGDLDAALAGDPTMIRFFPQAFSELTTAFYGDKTKISSELKEFQARGGALTFRSAQDLLEDRQFKEVNRLIADLDAKGNSAWKNLPRNTWKLLDKFLGSGIQKFSDFREQWIRYAVYLDYLHQMQNNNGIPNNWGASDKDEVMSIDDIRDRAFKMANELIGAYDQISESGRVLRDLLIPFYSWMEVNAKRYWQLLKNGLTEEEIGDFAQRFLKGQIANIPYYTYKAGKTLLFVSLFSILMQAFNNFFWPEDEEKLPPEIRERPHLVFGHDSNGNVLYFTQVGALFDLVDWFGLDTFRHDVKQIFNGQQTVTDWLKHISSAPFAKLVNGLTPLIKTPLELGSGRSFYPDVTNPRIINDRMQYLAQSFGLSWPLKFAKNLLNGYSYSNWHEFRNLFIYSQDAEQTAYFYTLSLVRQFRENFLGEKFSGYSTNKRTQALRDFKTALRFNDKNAAIYSLQQYYSLDGTDNGLKTSMRNMHPLHSLNAKNKDRFLQWISEEDRAFIQRAEAYYKKQLKRYDEAMKEFNAAKRSKSKSRQ